jgi:hypothetical protein
LELYRGRVKLSGVVARTVNLGEQLRELRVKAIIEPMLAGQELGETPNDDRQFLVDLGLVRRDPQGGLDRQPDLSRGDSEGFNEWHSG